LLEVEPLTSVWILMINRRSRILYLFIIAMILLLSIKSSSYSASVIDEKFENASGYDESGWSETVGASSSVDENCATTGGDPANWGDECLEVLGADGEDAYASQSNYGPLSVSYFRFEINIPSNLSDSYIDSEPMINVEYSEEDVAVLLRLQDDLMRESSSENFMENIEDKLSDIDAGTVSFIKEYARLILMSEEDFQKYLDHKAEFRSKLKSLLKE